jgi:hypothetical protein
MIHSDSPFCEIVSLKNYFTTEIVTMDSLLVQLHFTIRHLIFFKMPQDFLRLQLKLIGVRNTLVDAPTTIGSMFT